MPKDNVVCEARDDGRVRMFLVRDGKFHDGIEMPAKACGSIAANMLGSAKKASELAGLPDHPMGHSLGDVVALRTSQIGLAEGQTPEELALVFHMGQARLGILLTLERARELGQALLAASAPKDRPQ